MNDKTTLICIPCMDSVPTQFAQSLATLTRVGKCFVAFQMGSLIYTARNDLARKSLEMGADYSLWFDSDMVFETDVFQRLLDTMEQTNADIVSGLYFRRVQPYSPVIFSKLEIGEKTEWENCYDYPNEPFEVAGIGFGCVLMKNEVFIDVAQTYGNMFAPIGGVGEDLAFCWRARQCGYKIICDPNIKLGHVGHYVVGENMYKAFRGNKNE